MWKIVKFRKPNNRVHIFDATSKWLIQLMQLIWHWKAYENALLFHLESFFLSLNGLRVIYKIIQVLPRLYFQANFLTVRPNATNDMALESFRKCEKIWYILFLPISYGLSQFWKWLKMYFPVISANFIGMRQIIYRWKATENVKLFHVVGFLWFLAAFM